MGGYNSVNLYSLNSFFIDVVCNILQDEGGSSVEILTRRSHTVLKDSMSPSVYELPCCPHFRWEEWRSLFSIAF